MVIGGSLFYSIPSFRFKRNRSLKFVKYEWFISVTRWLFGVIRGYLCELWIYVAQQQDAKEYIIIHVILWYIHAMLLLKWAWRADIWMAPV